MKNSTIINQIILTFLCLTASTCFSNEDTGNRLQKRSGLPYDQLWGEAEVKEFLKLPYDKEFNTVISRICLKNFPEIDGINGFAVISKPKETSASNVSLGGILFNVCSADLSVFEVDIYNPVSCKSACDSFFEWVTFSLPLWNNIPEFFTPQYSDEDKAIYTLLRKGNHCEKFYFDTNKGIIIHVNYKFSSQTSTKLGNNDLLITQVNLIIKGLVTFLEGKYEITDKQKDKYDKIRQKYEEVEGNSVHNP